MSFTLSTFGAGFLPLCAVIFLFRRVWILPLLCTAAVLQGPAVATLELASQRYGVTPFLVTLSLVALDLVLRGPSHLWKQWQAVIRNPVARPWLLFLGWAGLTVILMPWMFSGLLVLPPLDRQELLITAYPLGYTANHAVQFIQVILLGLCLVWVFSFRDDPKLPHRLFVGVAVASALAAAVGLQQRLAWNGLVPLASEFWASNPSYAQNWQSLAGAVPRVSWPFIESAYASAFFAAGFGGFLSMFLADLHRHKALAAAMLCLFALANTLGATGVLAISVFAGLVVVVSIYILWKHRDWAGGLAYRLSLAGLAASCVMLAGFLVLRHYDLLAMADNTARNVLAGKSETVLGDIRPSAYAHSLRVLLESYGFGVGLGSHRGSSLILTIAANTGWIGLGLFLWAVLTQTRGLIRQAVHAPESASVFFLGSGACILIATAVAIPDQNWPVLWIFVLGGLACVVTPRDLGNEITDIPQPSGNPEGREGAV